MEMERSQNIMIFQNTKSQTLCNIMTTFFRSVPGVSYMINGEKSQKKSHNSGRKMVTKNRVTVLIQYYWIFPDFCIITIKYTNK